MAQGHAYVDAEGSVFFDTQAFGSANYGRLHQRGTVDEPHAEITGEHGKRHAADFALWKAHKAGEAAVFDSPWSPGRPGWLVQYTKRSGARTMALFLSQSFVLAVIFSIYGFTPSRCLTFSGILSVQPWPQGHWVSDLICTAAVSIWPFPITPTNWLNVVSLRFEAKKWTLLQRP